MKSFRLAAVVGVAVVLAGILPGCGYSREVASMRERIAKNPKDAFAHEQLSVLLFADDDKSSALKEINTAISLDPTKSFYRYRLATILQKTGKSDEALAAYVKAAELDGADQGDRGILPIASFEAAGLYEGKGDYRKAESQYELGLARLSAYKQDLLFTRPRSQEYWKKIQDDALQHLKRVSAFLAKERPTRVWVRSHIPDLEIPENKPRSLTGKDLQLKSQIESGDIGGDGPQSDLAEAYRRAGDPQMAVIHYLAALETSSDKWFYMDSLGFTYLALGRLDDAAASFRKCAASDVMGTKELAVDIESASKRFAASQK